MFFFFSNVYRSETLNHFKQEQKKMFIFNALNQMFFRITKKMHFNTITLIQEKFFSFFLSQIQSKYTPPKTVE